MIVSVLGAPMVGGAVSPGAGDANPATNYADSSLGSVQEGADAATQTNLSTANVTIRGNASNASVGASVIGAGDVNGDGIPDVLVGAPSDDASNNNSGAAYLFYGPIEDGEYNTSEADVAFTGENVGDSAGAALAAGDLNGDNYSDVVVGAPGHSVDNEQANDTNDGAAYVIYGNETLNGTVSLAESDAMVTGEAANDSAGHSLAVVPTGENGTMELAVGAPFNDAAGNNSGAVYVLASDTLGESVSLADADVKLVGEGPNAQVGFSVASAEDVTGDGTGDVLVGAPDNNSTMDRVTTVEAGAAYVVNGSQLQGWSGTISLADAELKLVGESAGDNAGWAVSAAGDVNGDGTADVLVGAPGDDAGGDNAGAAYVVLGGESITGTQSLANATLKLTGEGAGDLAGWAVSSAGSGDITCDDLADIVIGAPGNDSAAGTDSGAAYLVHGAENLSGVNSLSNADGKLHGEAEGDMAGYAVADVNDTSGDGLEDVAVGAPYNDANGADAGAVYIVNSECPPEPAPPTTAAPTTKAPKTTEAPQTTKAPKTTKAPTTSPPTTKAPKTTTPPKTTMAPPDKPKNVQVSVECVDENGTVTLVNEFSKAVTIEVTGPDGYSETVELEANGTSGDTAMLSGLADGEYEFDAETTDRGKQVTVNGEKTFTATVDCDAKPKPKDIIVTKKCINGEGAVTFTNPNDVSVSLMFDDANYELAANGSAGDSRTFTNLSGPYKWNADIGNEKDYGSGQVTVSCEEPEPKPAGAIVDVTCEFVEVDVSNIAEENVTIQVRFADSTTTTATMPTGSDGDFAGNVEFDNPENKTITGVRLFAGTEVDASKLLASDGSVNVVCEEPEPEPTGSIVDVTCEFVEVDVSDISERNVTVQVRFADSTTTTATMSTDSDGDFTGEIEFDNPENKTITGVRLFAGTEVDASQLLAADGSVNVVCEEPEEPEGVQIRDRCVEGQGQIQVRNPNQETTVRVVIRGPGGYGDTVTLAPGENETFDDLDDGEYVIKTFVEGQQGSIDRATVEIDCDQNGGDKIGICHKTQGEGRTGTGYNYLEISTSAISAHVGHMQGDDLIPGLTVDASVEFSSQQDCDDYIAANLNVGGGISSADVTAKRSNSAYSSSGFGGALTPLAVISALAVPSLFVYGRKS